MSTLSRRGLFGAALGALASRWMPASAPAVRPAMATYVASGVHTFSAPPGSIHEVTISTFGDGSGGGGGGFFNMHVRDDCKSHETRVCRDQRPHDGELWYWGA